MAPDAAISEMRAALEGERNTLRAQLEELGFGDGESGLEYDSNFADSSQVTAERGEAEAIATNLREALEDVEHALAKFDDGTYGRCEDCGGEISEARLEAMPAARVCMNCASKH
ncbi:MAG: DnaK suppressor protein [Acidimicrobiaceae bacterium]|jgi:DnaK suppressor protein|nr:DnaK suppressor protein [Acidimicrobiaceae bacterium]